MSVRSLVLGLMLNAIAGMAWGQDPLVAFPANYVKILDNAEVTVLRVHYGPHETVGVHNHSDYPTIYVYLNDSGPVRFSHDEQPPFVMTRPPTKLGSFRVSPGRPERHTVENLGDLPSDYPRIELKQLPLKTVSPVRGNVADPLKPGVTDEFKSEELNIRRVVCSLGPACINSLHGPALVVAFSPFAISPKLVDETNPGQRQMRNGDIQWEQDAKSIAVTASSPSLAHLLEIEFRLHQGQKP